MSEADAVVFVVDDDASVRRALARLLRTVGVPVMPCADAPALLGAVPYAGPACLLLDVQLPGLSGLELQGALHAAGLQMPIIFLTGYGTIPLSVQAMRAGAVDFLTKPVPDETLLAAVHRARAQACQAWQAQAARVALARRLETLTPRERDVLARIVRGMLNKQIASELGIAEKTVKIHRGRVMQKMQASSVVHLVRLADQLGLRAPDG